VAIVTARAVTFTYGDLVVVDDVCLELQRGEVLCLLGPNGSGKTTLLECILGLLAPARGEVTVDGLTVRGAQAAQLARLMAYVPQVHQRTFPYTVEQVVLMGRAAHVGTLGAPTERDRSIAVQAMRTDGVERFRARPYTQLSGGELQLVMIARALAQEAPLVIMDEPTTHLDLRNELLVLETIARLVHETTLTFIIATHLPNQALYLAAHGVTTRVALMTEGRLHAVGNPDEVLIPSNIRRVFGVDAQLIDYQLTGERRGRQVVPVGIVS